jgi:uncharacterized membrane protein YqiK
MANIIDRKISKDLLWKGIVEDLAEPFVRYFFPDYAHLIDHNVEELDRDGNIFGLALQAAREELDLQGQGLDLQRMEVKLRLLRRLLAMKVPKEKIRVLADFINYYIGFEDSGLYDKFDQSFSELTKQSQAMGVTETILHEMEKKITRAVTKRVKQQVREQMLEEMQAERKQAEAERKQAEAERKKAEAELEKAEAELERAKAEARAEARAESLKELETKERTFVLRIWGKGMSIEEIAELTDIPKEKVEGIIRKFGTSENIEES